MGVERVLFETEETADRARVAGFLRELADKVETGRVVLEGSGKSETVEVPETVTLEVKLEEEEEGDGVENSLEVELEWRPGAEPETGGISLG